MIETELYKAIEKIIKHPNPTICKHYAVLQVISAMINSGIHVNEQLIETISDGSESDEETLLLIKTPVNMNEI